MSSSDVRTQVAVALGAVQHKKAEDVALLQLPNESSTFTDYFLICSGHNPRQVQAIADEVDERLSKGLGVEPNTREGYETAEWILLDYVDFVVHIFNAQRRAYYDLERLWKSAHRLTADELLHPAKAAKRKAAPAAGAKRAAKKAAKKTPKKKSPAKKAASRKAAPKALSRGGAQGSARKPAASRATGTKRAAAKKKAAPAAAARRAAKKSARTSAKRK